MSYFAQDYASGALNLPNPPFVTVSFTCSPAALTGSSVCPAGIGSVSNGPPPIVAPNIPQLLGNVAAGLNSSLSSDSDYYPGAKVHVAEHNSDIALRNGRRQRVQRGAV